MCAPQLQFIARRPSRSRPSCSPSFVRLLTPAWPWGPTNIRASVRATVCLAIYSSSPLFLLLTPGSRAISSSVRGTEPSNFTPVSLSGSKNCVRAWRAGE